jgi:hypothetical protein
VVARAAGGISGGVGMDGLALIPTGKPEEEKGSTQAASASTQI